MKDLSVSFGTAGVDGMADDGSWRRNRDRGRRRKCWEVWESGGKKRTAQKITPTGAKKDLFVQITHFI